MDLKEFERAAYRELYQVRKKDTPSPCPGCLVTALNAQEAKECAAKSLDCSLDDLWAARTVNLKTDDGSSSWLLKQSSGPIMLALGTILCETERKEGEE